MGFTVFQTVQTQYGSGFVQEVFNLVSNMSCKCSFLFTYTLGPRWLLRSAAHRLGARPRTVANALSAAGGSEGDTGGLSWYHRFYHLRTGMYGVDSCRWHTCGETNKLEVSFLSNFCSSTFITLCNLLSSPSPSPSIKVGQRYICYALLATRMCEAGSDIRIHQRRWSDDGVWSRVHWSSQSWRKSCGEVKRVGACTRSKSDAVLEV